MATFPTVVAWISRPTFAERGIDPAHGLHAAQHIECAAPIAGPRQVRVESRVVGVQDKGVSRGAIVTLEQRIMDRRTGESIATLTTTCFGRKEGGCGDAGRDAAPPRHVPAREPDASSSRRRRSISPGPIAAQGTPTRCTPMRRSRTPQASRARSCMGSAASASRAGSPCRPSRTIPGDCLPRWRRASRHRSTRATRLRSTSGGARRTSHSASGSQNGQAWRSRLDTHGYVEPGRDRAVAMATCGIPRSQRRRRGR